MSQQSCESFAVTMPSLFLISEELATSQAEFGEAMILLGQKEGGALGKALTELGTRSDILANKSLKQVCS